MTDWVKMAQTNQGSGNSQSSSQPQDNLIQKGSDLFRALGLGAIPTIGAAAFTGGQAISQAMGNKNAFYNQQTGQNVQNPFATDQELSKFSTPVGAAGEAVKNTAGLASWGVPEINALKGAGPLTDILASVGNHAIQGAGQGALGAVSQGANPVEGAGIGAVVNPALTGAGNLLTDVLPKYIGLRNFGAEGLKLPDVINAQDAAQKAGQTGLKDARQTILDNIKPFSKPGNQNLPGAGLPADVPLPDTTTVTNTSPTTLIRDMRTTVNPNFKPVGGVATTSEIPTSLPAVKLGLNTSEVPSQPASSGRQALLDQISSLAQQPEWKGTPGLADLAKTSGKAAPQLTGTLAQINKVITTATDPFDAYSQIKNLAYPTDNTPASNRLAAFAHSAAHSAREFLINSSDNPSATRNAMDMYATQTAMEKGSAPSSNKIGGILASLATKQSPDIGLGALSFIPGMQGLGALSLADTTLTNPYTGPTIAKGLVRLGNNSGLGNLLTRLGISGAQGVASGAGQ